ncbi:MAG: endonuclease, partial [Saprospiraceae bacterium]|nr:endonuclease [Saprospiraceae bacterium]
TILYTEVDVFDGKINAIYSGYEVELDYDSFSTAIQAASAASINTEHIFPRSMGAELFPALSDMHHIIPALSSVNSARSNFRFAEVADNQTDKWYLGTQQSNSIPTSNINDWSELDEGTAWEPREIRKGDIARAVFYFVVIHNDTANAAFFNQMRDTLLDWHAQDPVDDREQTRNDRIKANQGNDNPFIIDSTLAERLFN